MGPQRFTLGLGVQIPGHQPRSPCSLGEEQKGRRLEKCELKPLHRTFRVVPPSLPNANQVAKLRRKLSPLCRERGGGQEPQRFSVPRRTRKPQPSPHLHASACLAGLQHFLPRSPGLFLPAPPAQAWQSPEKTCVQVSSQQSVTIGS